MHIFSMSNFNITEAGRLAVCYVLVSVFTLLGAACSGDPPGRLKIGDRAPAFTIVDLEGQAITSKNWQGSPVILRFWDTECKYCRADSPIINSYFDTYRQQGLKVLYVATANETVERVRAYIEELDIGFPVALDKDGSMTRDYQVSMVPQTVFISPDQKIITAVLGGVGEAELEELLGPYLP